MQRARQKEEVVKKEEEQVIAPTSGNRKCVVIMESDPTPGAVIGRMSFQNCNPSIEKLKDEADSDKHKTPTTSTADRNGMDIDRENGVSRERNGGLKQNRESDDSEDLQRKKLKVEAEADADSQSSYLSPTNSIIKNVGQSSTFRGRKTSQQGQGKLDWRHLRPPSGRTR